LSGGGVKFVRPDLSRSSFGQLDVKFVRPTRREVRSAQIAVGFVSPELPLASFRRNCRWLRFAGIAVGFVSPELPTRTNEQDVARRESLSTKLERVASRSEVV